MLAILLELSTLDISCISGGNPLIECDCSRQWRSSGNQGLNVHVDSFLRW